MSDADKSAEQQDGGQTNLNVGPLEIEVEDEQSRSIIQEEVDESGTKVDLNPDEVNEAPDKQNDDGGQKKPVNQEAILVQDS